MGFFPYRHLNILLILYSLPNFHISILTPKILGQTSFVSCWLFSKGSLMKIHFSSNLFRMRLGIHLRSHSLFLSFILAYFLTHSHSLNVLSHSHFLFSTTENPSRPQNLRIPSKWHCRWWRLKMARFVIKGMRQKKGKVWMLGSCWSIRLLV